MLTTVLNYTHIRNGKKVVKEERSVNGLTNLEKPFQAVAALPQDTPLDLAYSVDLTSTPPAPQITLYSIGGVRLKLTYNLNSLTHEDKNRLDSITWTFNQAGRLCKDLKVYANNQTPDGKTQCEDMASTTDGPVFTAEHSTQGDKETDHTLYWEPKEWNNTLNTTLTTTTHYKAGKDTITGYANGQAVTVDYPKIIQTLAIKTRELGPQAAGQEHRGNDVKMLEQMLWQLGLSPQGAKKGYLATRINENQRSIFTAGSTKESTSLELMLRRLQARGVGAETRFSTSLSKIVQNSTGQLPQDVLQQLKTLWNSYLFAVQKYPDTLALLTDYKDLESWLTKALALWEFGIEGKTNYVPATYKDEHHKKVLHAAGISVTEEYSREKLLKAWALTETHGQWENNYRMVLGGADEEGSIGFNQILHSYRYSKAPCTVHAEVALNHYDPAENLQGFVVHTAAEVRGNKGIKQSCGGAFFYTYASTGRGMKRIYSDSALKGYRQKTPQDIYGAVNTLTTQALSNINRNCQSEDNNSAHCEDAYDTFAKALAFYNGETIVRDWNNGLNGSWPEVLKKTLVTNDASQQDANAGDNLKYCHTCKYSINIRQTFKLPLRQYIWLGGTNTQGQEWCFGYGEEEWLAGKKFDDVSKLAIGSLDNPAVGRINCTTGKDI